MHNDLNLVGRYLTDEVELTGDAPSLRGLVKRLTTNESFLFDLSRPPISTLAAPYDDFLKSIRISLTDDGLVVINIQESVLEIIGTLKGLRAIAQSIELLASRIGELGSQVTPPHTHIEYFPEHPYLSASSISLIIILMERD